MPKVERKRFNSLDIAKVTAIILVVAGHYMPYGSPGWWVAVHNVIYTFHMPLFFFASGFLFAAIDNGVGYWNFMKRKFRRLMIPYFSASVVIICFKMLTTAGGDSSSLDNPVTARAFLEMFWEPSAGYFLWFIWALMWMFAVAGLFRGRKHRAALTVFAVILAYGPWEFTRLFCLEQARVMFVYFMLGAVGAGLRDKYPSGKDTTALIVAVIAFIAGETVFVAFPQYKAFVLPVLPYLGIATILLCSRQVDRYWKQLRKCLLWVAPYTYFIYLFHTTFEGVAKAVLHKVPLFETDSGLMFGIAALIIIAFGFWGPILAWRWLVGRIPLLACAFGGAKR